MLNNILLNNNNGLGTLGSVSSTVLNSILIRRPLVKQNLQPFTGNGDISRRVKNSPVDRKKSQPTNQTYTQWMRDSFKIIFFFLHRLVLNTVLFYFKPITKLEMLSFEATRGFYNCCNFTLRICSKRS